MPTATLPAFGGLSFFTAVVQQQQQRTKGCLLPVPAIAQHADVDEGPKDDGSSSTLLPCSRPGGWVQQAVQLTQDLGYVPQALAGVAAEAPRSKAERLVKKSSWSALCQQIQPSAKQCSSPGAAPAQAVGAEAACVGSPGAASATRCPQAPALALITASYVASFSNSSSSSRLTICTGPNSAGAGMSTTATGRTAVVAGLAAGLVLEEPVITAADTVWGKSAHMQGPTVLLCEPGELKQLWQEVPDDPPPVAWDAAYTKVCRMGDSIPAQGGACSGIDPSAGGSTRPTTAAPAVTPSIQSLVRALVLQQHQRQRSQEATAAATAPAAVCHGAAPLAAGAEAARPGSDDCLVLAAAAGQGTSTEPGAEQGTVPNTQPAPAGDAAATTVKPVAAASTSSKPAAAARTAGGQHTRSIQLQHLQDTVLDEPALSFAWLQPQDSMPGTRAPTGSARCPVSSIRLIQPIAAAEQAEYVSSILAAGYDNSSMGGGPTNHAPAAAAANTDAGITCLQVPAEACDAAGAAPAAAGVLPQQQQPLQHLLLPASAVPCALPLPACNTLCSSQQQPAEQAGQAAASKPQPQHPSTAHILLGWISNISRPKVRPKQAAGGSGAEAPVKKRQSAAVARAGRNTPTVSMQHKALCAPVGAAAAAETGSKAAACRTDAAADAGGAVPAAAAADQAVPGSDAPAAAAAAAASPAAEADADAEQHPTSQAAADSEVGEPATQDDSCPGQLSAGSLLIEVPVCIPEQPAEPLNAQYLRAALSAAEAVLDAAPEDYQLPDMPAASGAASDAELVAARSAVSMGRKLGWDASWGNLSLQQSEAARPPARLTGAAAGTAWCTPAVLDMLTGAALHAASPEDAAVFNQQQQQPGSAAAGQAPHSPQNQQQPHQHRTASLGAQLLEQMVAADMQLGDDSSSLLLPVVLFADTDSAWTSRALSGSDAAAAGPGICAELRAQCGYKRQSTAHLELYFDWSLLQPQQQLYSSSRRKRDSSCLLGLLGAKRLKTAAGEAVAAVSLQEQGQQEQDPLTWLPLLMQHPGLKKLQQDLSRKPTAPTAAADTPGDGAGCASAAQLVQSLSRQVYAAYLQQPRAPDTASNAQPPAGANAAQRPAGRPADAKEGAAMEAVPAEVAAAAAAWRLAREQSQSAPEVPSMGAAATNTAAAGAAAVLAARPSAAAVPSDLDFFMHLQGQHTQRNKRRHSMVPQEPATGCDDPAARPAGAHQTDQLDRAVPAVQQVSLPPAAAAPAKRARMSVMQQQQPLTQNVSTAGADMQACQDQADARQQRQQHSARATADLALNGVMTGAAAQQIAEAAAAAAEAAEAAAAAGPSVITMSVSGTILQLLLQLDSMRRSMLSAMQYPGPELVDSLLWQDSTAQQQLLQLKAQQHKRQLESGQGPSAQQRQHNKQLVVLVLLSQTAACLLHYGIRVAHMFLQHGLQRLPSILEACRAALSALSTASDALERLPASPAAAGVSTGRTQPPLPAAGEHPKLARLKDLVLRLKPAQPDCKLLLVAEAKAFFNLYHTLSAAGIIAVQLDRDRKLPMAAQTVAAAAVGSSSGADPAAQAAWAAGIQSALSAASCVLATHEQLHHPCMVLQGFHVLIEYIPWEHTGTGAAAGIAAGSVVTDNSTAAVHAHFGAGKHFIFAVQEPNLAQAAAEAERAAAQAAAGPADAVADNTAPTSAAADRDIIGQAPAARAQQQPAPAHAAAAAAAARTQQAAAQGAAAAAEEAPCAGQEVPLVLNISPGSLVKRRQSLYQSLMQLEAHGFVLVERPLAGSSRGGQTTGAAGLVGAAVDVVLTPRACLCIWDESKLPQEPEPALQALSRALLALSMSYDCVFFIFELGDNLLQPILHSSTNLQGLARAAGGKLQLLTCFSAPNTQDAVLHICKTATSGFWALSSPEPGTSSSTNSLQPPQGISDLPTAAEAQLATCCALNPLSATVLASHGATLGSLFEVAVTDEGQQHPLLQACLPAKSLQLLQVQASAAAERIQQQQQQQQEELLQQSQEDQQQQQQMMYQQQQMYQAEAPAQQQQQQEAPYMPDIPGGQLGDPKRQAAQYGGHQHPSVQQQQQQQWDQHQHHYGDASASMWEEPGTQHMRQHNPGMRTQQPRQQQQPEQLLPEEPGFDEQMGYHAEDPFLQSRHSRAADLEDPALWQDEGQQQHVQAGQWGGPANTGQRSAQQGQRRQQGMREGGPVCLPAETGLDPSAVLDDILDRRSPAAPAAPAGTRSMYSRRAGMPDAAPVQRVRQSQQEQYGRAGPAAGGETPAMQAAHRPHWQQQQQQQFMGGMYAGQGGPGRRNGMRMGPESGFSPAPWAAADVDAAGFDGFEPGGGRADFLQVAHNNAFEDGGADCAPWDEGPAQDFDFDGMPGGLGSMPAYGRSSRGPVRQAPGPTDPFFDECAADFEQTLPHSVPRGVRAHPQRGQTGACGVGQGQRTASRGGMFATAPQGMQDMEDDDDLFAVPPAPNRQAGQRHGTAAAAAGGGGNMQGRRQYPAAAAAAGYGSRGVMGKQPARRGFAGPTSSNTSSLSVPAFMPHHNPSKQLKYRAPAAAAAAGVVKRKKGGLQTKLCWG